MKSFSREYQNIQWKYAQKGNDGADKWTASLLVDLLRWIAKELFDGRKHPLVFVQVSSHLWDFFQSILVSFYGRWGGDLWQVALKRDLKIKASSQELKIRFWIWNNLIIRTFMKAWSVFTPGSPSESPEEESPTCCWMLPEARPLGPAACCPGDSIRVLLKLAPSTGKQEKTSVYKSSTFFRAIWNVMKHNKKIFFENSFEWCHSLLLFWLIPSKARKVLPVQFHKSFSFFFMGYKIQQVSIILNFFWQKKNQNRVERNSDI